MAWAGIQRLANIFESHTKATGQTGNHCIRVSSGDHACCKDVAILIYHALTVTVEHALAGKANIQEIQIGLVLR